MRVEHIVAKTGEELKGKINNWLKNNSAEVVDIKYSSSDMDFSALIIYKPYYLV